MATLVFCNIISAAVGFLEGQGTSATRVFCQFEFCADDVGVLLLAVVILVYVSKERRREETKRDTDVRLCVYIIHIQMHFLHSYPHTCNIALLVT